MLPQLFFALAWDSGYFVNVYVRVWTVIDLQDSPQAPSNHQRGRTMVHLALLNNVHDRDI